MRWRAQLSWRLPPRSRRWRWCLPELASRGATPAWRASCASVGKRSIGPISQSSLAALKRSAAGELEQPWRERGPRRVAPGRARGSSASVCGSGRGGRGRSAPVSSVRGGRAGGRAGRARPRGRAHPAAPARVGSSSCRCQRSRCWAASPLRDQVVTVVDEQLQLPQRLLAGTRAVQ